MAAQRKTRTREHVIASQSVAHIESLIVSSGYVAEKPINDYGYDLNLITFDSQGGMENGCVYFQVKATDRLTTLQDGRTISFRLDWRDVALWREEAMPVILIVHDALHKVAYWLYTQEQFESDAQFQAKDRVGTVTVYLSKENKLDEPAIERFRRFKRIVLDQLQGKVRHHG